MPTINRRALAGLLVLGSAGCGGGDQGTDPDPIDRTPATIEVTPATDTVFVGNRISLAAKARTAAGTVVSASFTWSSSDPARATVSAAGLVTPLEAGVVWIRAETGTLVDSAEVYLAPAVTILRRLPSLFVGDTTQMRATYRRVPAGPIAPAESVWSSSNPGVAAVGASGVITGLSSGFAMIHLTSTGGRDSQQVVVLPKAPRPDRQVAYLREITRASDSAIIPVILVANPDGSGEVQVSPENHYVIEYAWSSSGNHLIAWHFGYPGPSTFSVISADGSAVQDLPITARSARFSPDDSKLAYHDGEGSGVVIKTANVDGTNVRMLTVPGGENEVNPEWSPDGRQIAYREDPCNRLWVMDADGSNRRVLASGACFHMWAPDGKEIAYVRNGGVWVVNVETEVTRPLSPNCDSTTCGAPQHTSASWRWDGQRIAMPNTGVTNAVTLVDRDGGDVTPLDMGAPIGSAPRWSPSGTVLGITVGGVDSTNPNITRIKIFVPSGVEQVAGPIGTTMRWRP